MYDFKNTEEAVIRYWEEKNIYLKNKELRKSGKKFYFLQGPPYTSGKLHMGHAWNNALKDMLLRYKRMKGFNVWDRGGYDMHGLPTERKVMELHSLKTKEEILEYGMEKFIQECIQWSSEKAGDMDRDLWRLGIWFDHKNAYWPIKNEYIEGVWWLIKKAHENKRLYRGLKTMSWCPNCATAMAKHECEYKLVTEKSIFVKLKLKGKENEYFIIWTTTPWTIAYNLAIMVNPTLDYVRARVGNEVWIVAKGLLGPVVNTLSEKGYHVLEEFKGEKLEGQEYVHPWEGQIKQFKELKEKHPKVHTVLLSEDFVNLTAGSGLVHCAPGCGPEDYEIGHKNNVPPFNNLKEDGTFPEDMGIFSGKKAKKEDEFFIEKLTEAGVLLGITDVEHDYAHCERCRSPVIFRATKQWFFKTEDLKEKMLEANSNVLWVPEAGKNAFGSWLKNLRDNSITKQRFWGTPAPIWVCDSCGKYEVVASREELKKLNASKIPENLHKPWIDDVKIKCSCGSLMDRIPDVLDVWIDAGCASWICLYYPEKEDFFKEYFPADFILEAREQVRGWFNLLMVASMIAMDKPCFKSAYMHGMLTDVEGEKMSKSLGNVISPYEMVDKHGADTLRFYMCRTSAGEDINFSWDEAKLKYKNLSILWNVHQYLIEYAKNSGINPSKDAKFGNALEDRHILSKLNSTIREVTKLYDAYRLDEVPEKIENLFLDLSRTYIQLTRDRISEKPEEVIPVIHAVLMETIKMLSTVSPFISEAIFLNIKQAFRLDGESITMLDWPSYHEKLIDPKLEQEFALAENIIQAMLSAREKASLSVRWPLAEATVLTRNKEAIAAVNSMKELIKYQTNVKEVNVKEEIKGVTIDVKENKGAIGRDFKKDAPKILSKVNAEILKRIMEDGKADVGEFELTKDHIIVNETLPQHLVASQFKFGNLYIDTKLSPELESEGFARELTRRVQLLRKENGMKKADRIKLSIFGNCLLDKWASDIKAKVGAYELHLSDKNYAIKAEAKIKDVPFRISLEKSC
ncbi:MAG: isoleucine--tRNA ligase [Candidatus Woesearchaeota archaeon]